jgi:hypothetical protein
LLVVSASPPLSDLLTPLHRNRAAHPPGPGFPLHAPSVNISTISFTDYPLADSAVADSSKHDPTGKRILYALLSRVVLPPNTHSANGTLSAFWRKYGITFKQAQPPVGEGFTPARNGTDSRKRAGINLAPCWPLVCPNASPYLGKGALITPFHTVTDTCKKSARASPCNAVATMVRRRTPEYPGTVSSRIPGRCRG